MKSIAKMIGTLLTGAVLACAQTGTQPEVALRAAMELETVKGDLRGAIQRYARLAEGKDRAVAAKALVRMAQCHEKLGNAEARKIYERVLREYGDQVEAVTLARARLGGTSTRATLAARQLWTGRDIGGRVPFEIAPASDGRSLLFVDWGSGDVGIRDLDTGSIKRLGLLGKSADHSGLKEFAQFALYSPDQRQIAYTWHALEDGSYYDFRVISTQPGAKPRVLIQHPELVYFKPFAWSPDGTTILTLIWKRDGTTQIAWVSAAEGSFRTLKSLEWRNPEMVSLSPDGRWIAYDALKRQDSADREILILSADGSTEAAAVTSPGIDNYPVWTPDGGYLVFTSNRSRNFGLYALAIQDGKPQGAAKLLKPDVGGITLCGFVRSGALYYLQPTGEQNVYLADLDPATGKLRGASAPLGGAHTGRNRMPALSPDGKHVAYVSTEGAQKGGAEIGPSTLVVKSLETQVERGLSTGLELVASPEWFPDGRTLLIAARNTKSGGTSLYRFDVESGRFTLIVNVRNGIRPHQVGLSPDGEMVYMPGSDGTGSYSVLALSLSTGELKTLHQTKGYVRVALSRDGRTLAAVETNGAILLMNTDGSSVRTFHDSGAGWASGIAWASDGKHLLFARRSRMQDEWELWRKPVDGGEPSPTGIRGPYLGDIHSGPDGAITYTAGFPKQAELWALDSLLPLLKASK